MDGYTDAQTHNAAGLAASGPEQSLDRAAGWASGQRLSLAVGDRMGPTTPCHKTPPPSFYPITRLLGGLRGMADVFKRPPEAVLREPPSPSPWKLGPGDTAAAGPLPQTNSGYSGPAHTVPPALSLVPWPDLTSPGLANRHGPEDHLANSGHSHQPNDGDGDRDRDMDRGCHTPFFRGCEGPPESWG